MEFSPRPKKRNPLRQAVGELASEAAALSANPTHHIPSVADRLQGSGIEPAIKPERYGYHGGLGLRLAAHIVRGDGPGQAELMGLPDPAVKTGNPLDTFIHDVHQLWATAYEAELRRAPEVTGALVATIDGLLANDPSRLATKLPSEGELSMTDNELAYVMHSYFYRAFHAFDKAEELLPRTETNWLAALYTTVDAEVVRMANGYVRNFRLWATMSSRHRATIFEKRTLPSGEETHRLVKDGSGKDFYRLYSPRPDEPVIGCPLHNVYIDGAVKVVVSHNRIGEKLRPTDIYSALENSVYATIRAAHERGIIAEFLPKGKATALWEEHLAQELQPRNYASWGEGGTIACNGIPLASSRHADLHYPASTNFPADGSQAGSDELAVWRAEEDVPLKDLVRLLTENDVPARSYRIFTSTDNGLKLAASVARKVDPQRLTVCYTGLLPRGSQHIRDLRKEKVAVHTGYPPPPQGSCTHSRPRR